MSTTKDGSRASLPVHADGSPRGTRSPGLYKPTVPSEAGPERIVWKT
jgi:hypothetical protein